MTVLLEYLDLSISAGRAQLRFGGPSPALGYVTEKQTRRLKALLSLEACYFIICLLCQHYARSLPIMPALCLMLWHAYYASNYAGIIGAGLMCVCVCVCVCMCVCVCV